MLIPGIPDTTIIDAVETDSLDDRDRARVLVGAVLEPAVPLGPSLAEETLGGHVHARRRLVDRRARGSASTIVALV